MSEEFSIKKGGQLPIYTSYRGGSGAVFSVDRPTSTQGAPSTSETFSGTDETKEYQDWGPDNLWPTNSRLKIQRSTTAYPLMAKTACLLYGKGPTYYKEKRTKDGVEIDWSPEEEVDAFFAENNIAYFLLERLMDYKMFGNCFSEIILDSQATPKATTVNHLEAEFSRFGKIQDKIIKDIKYNSDWTAPNKAVPIDFLMRRDQTRVKVLEKYSGSKKFVIHSCLPSPGSTLYARPPHIGLLEDDGWLDYSISIPKILNAINKNGFHLKYHIRIPANYWASSNPDWETLAPKKREEIMEAEFTKMDEFLKGTDNAGNSFISHFGVDPLTGKETVGWEFVVLDDKIKVERFITSVQEADIQTSRAIGMDASLSSIQPSGGKMGAGSGSDKRTAFTNTISMSHAEQMVIMEPLILIQKINEWDPSLRFVFEHDIPTTLNENKDGVKSEIQ